MIDTLCFVWGISIGLPLHSFNISAWTSLFTSIAIVIIILGVGKWSLPKLDALEKERVMAPWLACLPILWACNWKGKS